MIGIPSRCASAATFALIALIASRCAAVNDVAGNLIVLNDNGAWSWFEDERAIIDLNAGTAGKLIVSSVGSSAGTGGAARNGDVEVASLDLATSAVSRFTLSDALQADDHDSAAFYRRSSDGRYVAMYSKHGNDSLTRYRISTNAGDISNWGSELTITNAGGTTYSNVHYLSAENAGSGKLYNIARTLDLDAHVSTSNDQGLTWTASAGRLLNWPTPTGDPKYTGTDGSRPYLKYASNGVDEIHFITSTDHPRAYDNSIYHGVIKNGKVYDSFGVEVDSNLFDGTAKKPTDYTTVFNTDTSPLSYAWTTDLQLDSQGRPYALFTARKGSNSLDHRFLYARFTGTQWNVHEIAKAGEYLYASESDYTGLGALDPSNPNRLFISSKIDPRTQATMNHYEIFEGNTTDGGATWAWLPITYDSNMNNLRPIVPKWDANHTALLWMRGSYSTYTSYDLDVVALTAIGTLDSHPLGDLDFDHDVDLSDYSLYLSGLNMNLTGLSLDDSYKKGDLNGDFANNFQDFRLFRGAYDTFNGAGAFDAIGAVPEPHEYVLLTFGLLACGAAWRSRGRRRAIRVFSTVVVGYVLFAAAKPALALDIKVDIDSRRTSSTDTSAAITTQSGFTSWDLTNVATSGSTIAVDGITFEIFGLAGANQSRNRNNGGGGAFNNVLTDFVYNEGGTNGIYTGLRISNLPVGSYSMQSWHYDTLGTVLSVENYTQVETRTMGGSGVTVADMVPFSQTPIYFSLDVTAAGQVKEVVFREDDVATATDPTDSNRSRLNAFTIATQSALTLEVNTTTGATRIVNNQIASFDLNYYEIRSIGGTLIPASWISLDDTDAGADPMGTGWDESPNSGTKLLNEIRLEQKNTLSPGQSEGLGQAFTVGGAQDLSFFYAGPNDTELRVGAVTYVSGTSPLLGDYNNNGVVDAADYVVWRNGGPLQNEGRSTGINDLADYMFWRARFGAATNGAGSFLAGSSVPEPPCLSFVVLALSVAAAAVQRGQFAASRR